MIAAAPDPSPIKTREQEADAYFLAGQYCLAQKRPEDARKMFTEAVNRKVPYTSALIASRAQLGTIGK